MHPQICILDSPMARGIIQLRAKIRRIICKIIKRKMKSEKFGPRGWRQRCAGVHQWLPRLLFLSVLSVLVPAAAHAQPVEVRIAGQEALMPKWVHLRNRAAGICPDILMAIERVEPRLRFSGYRQSRSLTGIETGLENGSLDAACGLSPSPRRRAIGQAAGPAIYMVRHRLVARAGDDADIHSVRDLERLHALVIAQRGAIFTDELRAAGIRIDDATDDNGVNLHKMLAGHGRFLDINELTLKYYLHDGGLAQRVRILPAVLKEEPTYFWVSRKADPDVAHLIGAALEKLRASGELERIYVMHTADL
jgi:glutamate/aspartate transport system substrate-binding protein